MAIPPDATEIPLDLIDPANPQLRPVRENTAQFAEMADQIARDGHVLNAVLVRPTGTRYQICDGNRRRAASIRAGVETLFCVVREMDDKEYLAKQIECNAGHEDTDWIEYATHLERLRRSDDTEMTLDQLAEICGKHSRWVSNVLSLNRLIKAAKQAVKLGEMPVGNAKALSKLPDWEQSDLLEDAMTLPTAKFRKIATQAVTRFREQVKQGKLERLGKINMEPRMRKMELIMQELDEPSEIPLVLASQQIENPVEIIKMTINWIFRLDPESIFERQDKLVKQEEERLAKAALRKKDRTNVQGLTQ